MKKYFRTITSLIMTCAVLTFVSGCDTTENPTTPDPDVNAPTNLKAYSDDGKIGLTWTASTSESQSNFSIYEISHIETGTSNTAQVRTAPKGSTNFTLDGLTNGKRYTITIRSKTIGGKTSSNFETVEWSPAVRNSKDINSQTINVYATTSSAGNSGLVFNGTGNKVEVIPQASADWRARGDFYLLAQSSTTNILKINSPNLANNAGQKVTQFSTVQYDVDDLNASSAQTAPPTAQTYTDASIDIIDQAYAKSKIFWARIQGTGTNRHTVRFLVKRGANGKLVQGSGDDRYITLEVSLQTDPGNPYAKK